MIFCQQNMNFFNNMRHHALKSNTFASDYKHIYWTIVSIILVFCLVKQFYDLFKFYVYDATATKVTSVSLRGSLLNEVIKLMLCNPLWLNYTRVRELNISQNVIDFAMTFFDPFKFDRHASSSASNEIDLAKTQFLKLFNKSDLGEISAGDIRAFIDDMANKQEYYSGYQNVFDGLIHVGYAFSDNKYCEILKFRDNGDIYNYARHAAGFLGANIFVDFRGKNESAVNLTLSFNAFDLEFLDSSLYGRAFSVTVETGISRQSLFKVNIVKHTNLFDCQPPPGLYIPWSGMSSQLLCSLKFSTYNLSSSYDTAL